MKQAKHIAIALLLLLCTAPPAEAKKVQKQHVYMFGFSASFRDSTVYFTDIQDVRGAWLDSRTKFLLGRDNYAYQLRNYMTDSLNEKGRINMVIFGEKLRKVEKKYEKMKKLYTVKAKGGYDVHYLPLSAFRFEAVDMSDDE